MAVNSQGEVLYLHPVIGFGEGNFLVVLLGIEKGEECRFIFGSH